MNEKPVMEDTLADALSVRARNCLDSAGILTWAQLAQMTKSELANVKNLGRTTTSEIQAAMANRGLLFRNIGPRRAAAPGLRELSLRGQIALRLIEHRADWARAYTEKEAELIRSGMVNVAYTLADLILWADEHKPLTKFVDVRSEVESP